MVGHRLIGLVGLIILLNGCSDTISITIETLQLRLKSQNYWNLIK